MVEIRCVVLGQVQKVAYRVYVQDSAATLGLTGWVQNLHDGSVEVVAQGSPDELKELVEYLHEGSLLARVDSVAVDWQSVKETFEDFSIKL